jgi:hypothetical protein
LPDAKDTVYQHTLVCLAEGLKSFGIPIYVDRNFWQSHPEREEYLLNFDPNISPNDCSIIVWHTAWFTANRPMSVGAGLFHPKREYITVYLESEQGKRI